MDKGPDVNVFLGIKVNRNSSVGTLTMTQLALINRVLKEISLDDNNVKLHDTLANTILTKSEELIYLQNHLIHKALSISALNQWVGKNKIITMRGSFNVQVAKFEIT